MLMLMSDFSLSNLLNRFGPQAPSFADQLRAAESEGGAQGGAQGGQGLMLLSNEGKLLGLLLQMLAGLLLSLLVAGLFTLLLLLTMDIILRMRVMME